MNIVQALDDPDLFHGIIRDHSTWGAWRAFLKSLFGLPMDDAEATLFRQCTKRQTLPIQVFATCWLACGRRAGKSNVLALVAIFLAVFSDYTPYLSVGERATIVIVASDRKQARTIFRYISGIMAEVPALAPLVEGETNEELRLTNGVSIEVMTASSRSIRGYAIPVALLDEAAFWSVEGSTDADVDIIGALRPAMKQFPGAMLLGASSPYSRRGALWEAYKAHHGQDASRTLVWQAPTWVMNPTISREDLDPEFKADPARAESEYGAAFRSDIEGFITQKAIDDATDRGVNERLYEGRRHVAFVDPSGGSKDSMTLAIAHVEETTAILDVIREVKPPFSPEGVTKEFADLLKSYGLKSVVGDRYAGLWVREPFQRYGIKYELTEMNRSEIYQAVLPLINSSRARLLDNPRLAAQFFGLERRTSSVGRDNINHAPGGHDDVANAAAGALVLAADTKPRMTAEQQRALNGWVAGMMMR